jgi:hypothetical protein
MGLECSRCSVFASSDGRIWNSRAVFEEEWARTLPQMRKAFVAARVGAHVFPASAPVLLELVESYLSERGYEKAFSSLAEHQAQLKSKRQCEGDRQIHFVATVTEVEPGKATLRIQQHTLTPGWVTRFDCIRSLDTEVAVAQRLDVAAVQAFQAEAEKAFQETPGL